jgi:hypothetical protein
MAVPVPMMDMAAIAPAKNPTYLPTLADENAFILGGTAQGVQDSLFEVLLEQLLEFKMVFGHCLVPFECAENPTLSRWVLVQRTQHVQGRMKASHAQRLESIGFSWNPPQLPPKLVASNSKKSGKNKVTTTTIVDPTASLVPANERQEMRERKQMRLIHSAGSSNVLKTTPKLSQEEKKQEAPNEEELVESNETEAPPPESNKERVPRFVKSVLEAPNQEAWNLKRVEANDTRTDESMLEEDLAAAPKLAEKTGPALFEKSFGHLTGRRMTGPQVGVAGNLERNGATAASQEERVAASTHKFEYPIGTRIDKVSEPLTKNLTKKCSYGMHTFFSFLITVLLYRNLTHWVGSVARSSVFVMAFIMLYTRTGMRRNLTTKYPILFLPFKTRLMMS